MIENKNDQNVENGHDLTTKHVSDFDQKEEIVEELQEETYDPNDEIDPNRNLKRENTIMYISMGVMLLGVVIYLFIK